MQFALNTLKFEDIRNQAVNYLRENSDFGKNIDFKGSNISYITNVMAYVNMLLNYNLSNTANNLMLDSTEIRKNAVSIVKNIGYRPKRPRASRLTGKFRYYGEDFDPSSKITIKEFSRFISDRGNVFTNFEPIILRYQGDPTYLEGEYILYQGSMKNFTTFGDGKIMQSFVLPQKDVDEDYFRVYVHPNTRKMSKLDEWTEVRSFNEIISQKIFFVEEDVHREGYPKVIFGNGIIGAVPKDTDVITVEYLETRGSASNGEVLSVLPSETSFELSLSLQGKYNFKFDLKNFDDGYSNPNNISYGGTDLESLETIKITAPRFFSTINRLATKQDYYSFLEQDPTLQSVNVLGGEDYYTEEGNHLGNIYITAVPKLPDNIYNAQKLYLTDLEENKILFDLKDIVILSTKRHFFKPSYIFADIVPYVEILSTLPASKQAEVKSIVKSNLDTYVKENFSKLGQPFRSSKFTSMIDQLKEVISSEISISYYFLINAESFYTASTSDDANFIYLPLIGKERNNEGVITSYDSFIRTNVDIVDEQIFAETGTTVSTLPMIEANLMRYPYLISMDPTNSSIYGSLYHPYLNREMYTVDYSEMKIIEATPYGNSISFEGSTFVTADGYIVSVSVDESPDNKLNSLIFSTSKEGSLKVGTIVFSAGISGSEVGLIHSESDIENLNKFGLTVSEAFDLFEISYEKGTSRYYIYIKLIGNTNQSGVKIAGKNKLVDFNLEEVDPSFRYYKPLSVKIGESFSPFKFVDVPSEGKTEISLTVADGNTYIVGYIEPNNTSFLGALDPTNSSSRINRFNSPDSLDRILNGTYGPYTHGQYFIYSYDGVQTKFLISTGEKILGDGEIIIFDSGQGKFVLSANIGKVSGKYTENLFVTFKESNIYRISADGNFGGFFGPESYVTGDYVYFHSGKWIKASDRVDIQFDATKAIFRELEHDDLKLIVNSELPTTFEGKLGFGVSTNDLILYDKDVDNWVLIGNTDQIDGTNTPVINGTLPPPDPTVTLVNRGNVFLVDTPGDLAGSPNIIWPSSTMIKQVYSGDLLVYVGDGKYLVFDYSYKFNLDASDPYFFPISLNIGDVFEILDGTVGNFASSLQDTFDGDLDSIIYLGDNSWGKFGKDVPGHCLGDLSAAEIPEIASTGDILTIIEEGDFGGSALIKSENRMCYPNDKLIFIEDPLDSVNSGWYKALEYSVYPTENLITGMIVNNGKKILNDFGFKSDLYFRYNPTTRYFELMSDDIFDGSDIGTFSYDTGRITFFNRISGSFSYVKETTTAYSYTNIKNFFNNYDDTVRFDKIRIIPSKKLDGLGSSTLNDVETDFDTLFNQYVSCFINPIEDKV